MKCNKTILIGLATSVSILPLLRTPTVGAQTPPAVVQPNGSATEAPISLRDIDLLDLEDLANKKIDLSVTDTDASSIVGKIGEITHARMRVEMRSLRPAKFSLSVRQMEIGNILKAVAALEGGNFHILPGYYLLAPDDALKPAELSYSTNKTVREPQQQQALLKSLLHTIQQRGLPQPNGQGSTQVAVAQLDEHTQRVLQRLVNMQTAGTATPLMVVPGNAQLIITPNQQGNFNLELSMGRSQKRSCSWLNVQL